MPSEVYKGKNTQPKHHTRIHGDVYGRTAYTVTQVHRDQEGKHTRRRVSPHWPATQDGERDGPTLYTWLRTIAAIDVTTDPQETGRLLAWLA